MKRMIVAVLFIVSGAARADTYQCPPPINAAQVACTFKSIGGTTTYTAIVAAQATGEENAALGLFISLNNLACSATFGSQSPVTDVWSASGTCTFQVTSKQPVNLLAVAQNFNLTPLRISLGATSSAFVPDNNLAVVTVGSGSVISADGGINCGSDCSESYGANATATLVASAADGWAFKGWSGGGCSGSALTCAVAMNDNKIVTATFEFELSPSVVEFYNTMMDHYFITADANEANGIDNGVAGPGWSRTGLSFKTGGNKPVCRFYGSPSPGPNSHFYTANADECNYLKNLAATTPSTQPRWNYEGFAFATSVPVGQVCPSLSVPVYRAYNNAFQLGKDSNHRFSTSANAIQEVIARGWLFEGVVMCARE